MTSIPTIATIVEGQGEVKALPVLLRRIASELLGFHHLILSPPFRVARHKMTKDGLGRAAYVQAARVTAAGGVLVVAVAVREFESWFLGAVESLRGHRSVRADAAYDKYPEARRGAKEALSALMSEPYRETLHQPAFAALVDLHQAQRVRSFAHLVRCVERLLGASSASVKDIRR